MGNAALGYGLVRASGRGKLEFSKAASGALLAGYGVSQLIKSGKHSSAAKRHNKKANDQLAAEMKLEMEVFYLIQNGQSNYVQFFRGNKQNNGRGEK